MYYLAIQPSYTAFRAPIVPAITATSGPPPQKKGSERLTRRLPSRLNLHSVPLLPAVSFLGGFQTPAGPQKTCAHPSGRHLKPITGADIGLISESARYWGMSRCA